MKIIPVLRNIYDQYDQEENRLTHPLCHTITSDKKLFVDFIKFVIGKFPFIRKTELYVRCQGRYGYE